MSQSLRPLETSSLYNESVAKLQNHVRPTKTTANHSPPKQFAKENTAVSCERCWVFSLARRMNFLAFIQSLFQVQFDVCAHHVRIWIVSLVTFFGIENVIPYSPFYNPPFQAHVSCISKQLTKPHLPRSAQATNVPHNHWRYRTAPMGSPTMAHWSLVSKLPNSKLKYCCCNKTGKQKELPKRSHAPKK